MAIVGANASVLVLSVAVDVLLCRRRFPQYNVCCVFRDFAVFYDLHEGTKIDWRSQ